MLSPSLPTYSPSSSPSSCCLLSLSHFSLSFSPLTYPFFFSSCSSYSSSITSYFSSPYPLLSLDSITNVISSSLPQLIYVVASIFARIWNRLTIWIWCHWPYLTKKQTKLNQFLGELTIVYRIIGWFNIGLRNWKNDELCLVCTFQQSLCVGSIA